MRRLLRLSIGFSAASLLGACTLDAQGANGEPVSSPEADYSAASSAPIAEVTLDDGAALRFYEPEPGYIITAKLDRIGRDSVPAQGDGETATDYYERLAKQPAPEALLAAERRELDRLAQTDRAPRVREAIVDEPEPQLEQPQLVNKAFVDDSWFWAMCPTSWGIDASHYAFREYRQVTAHNGTQIDDVLWARAIVLNVDGPRLRATFKIRPWYTWSAGTYVDLDRGEWIEFRDNHQPNTDFDAKVNVSNSGNAFFDLCIWGQDKYY